MICVTQPACSLLFLAETPATEKSLVVEGKLQSSAAQSLPWVSEAVLVTRCFPVLSLGLEHRALFSSACFPAAEPAYALCPGSKARGFCPLPRLRHCPPSSAGPGGAGAAALAAAALAACTGFAPTASCTGTGGRLPGTAGRPLCPQHHRPLLAAVKGWAYGLCCSWAIIKQQPERPGWPLPAASGSWLWLCQALGCMGAAGG